MKKYEYHIVDPLEKVIILSTTDFEYAADYVTKHNSVNKSKAFNLYILRTKI